MEGATSPAASGISNDGKRPRAPSLSGVDCSATAINKRRKPPIAISAVLAVFLLTSPKPAHAQEVHIAPQVSLADDVALGLGGRALVNPSDMEGYEIAGSFDYFVPGGNTDYWKINGNLH